MKELTDLHKEAFATWRFQIESYWTRNGYFAGFEIAALGGVVAVSKDHHWTGLFMGIAALLLTIIWFFNCDRQHEYIKFWWEKLIEFDTVGFEAWEAAPKVEGLRPVLLAADFERWRSARDKRAPWRRYQYSMMVLLVLVIFMVLWVGVIWYNGHMLEDMGLLKHPFKAQLQT